ncbi:hypothetical protein B0A50_06652 [Salinomyces thailandicus]|uniref:3-phytase n=1 Tax=Salinomyces thailandicus TaxID=706561 RepID=A0A4U0TRU3_9PEZI|nr:hypothetical protein B0A50_06652 [Salinomyces thailandica]
MTTLRPRTPYTEAELATLYPPHLQLQQVQILLRHGERTPISARFKNTGLPAYWPYCTAAKNLTNAVLTQEGGGFETLAWRRKLETLDPKNGGAPALARGPEGEAENICMPGELTDKGRETTLALGRRLRGLYVERLGFLPERFEGGGTVGLRSTVIPRALESVLQVFSGLYPKGLRDGASVPEVVMRGIADETLFPNEAGCKRFGQLAAGFAARAAGRWNESEEMGVVEKGIGKWMPEGVRVEGRPRLSGVMDTINATLAHGQGTKLPKEFYEDGVMRNVDRICTDEWFGGYQESKEYRRLGIGGLVGDVTQRMVEHVSGRTVVEEGKGRRFRMGLAGCHDTTIAATLASLGAFDVAKDTWPKYTSSIAFELFQKRPATNSTASSVMKDSSPTRPSLLSPRTPLASLPASAREHLNDYYVRLRYNDHPVTLPYCRQSPDRHLEGDPSFCTLAAFKAAADEVTPADWKRECGERLGEPAVPEVVERVLGMD